LLTNPSPTREDVKQVVVDTSGFFAGAAKLGALLADGFKLIALDLIIFEFVKVVDREINLAKQAAKLSRVKTLTRLRDQFPALLQELEIELISPEFSIRDLKKLYSLTEDKDPGDCMIWLKMQNAGYSSILTDNTKDWKKLGADVIGIYDKRSNRK